MNIHCIPQRSRQLAIRQLRPPRRQFGIRQSEAGLGPTRLEKSSSPARNSVSSSHGQSQSAAARAPLCASVAGGAAWPWNELFDQPSFRDSRRAQTVLWLVRGSFAARASCSLNSLLLRPTPLLLYDGLLVLVLVLVLVVVVVVVVALGCNRSTSTRTRRRTRW